MCYNLKDSRPRNGTLGLWEKQHHRPTCVLLPHKAQNRAGWVSSRNSSGEAAMLLSETSVLMYQDYDERFLARDEIGKTFLSLTEYAFFERYISFNKWHDTK
ncbi:hypothetical protein FVEG_17032 [Fusarium verticillioides 7600]|uniref:Uncharacterized protein n=1 Tax=Gibberella moniliformis (strain M3125 / FGSC 7600) TaxID=334819 RepID=W7MN53_GIBM7|nr:hypothetical protein FVEG_17032 [Fusarium verticillioides 7600]EWG52868.1 hypothetical protein FVEG_17032 [Fusarium verticillioides 7600]